MPLPDNLIHVDFFIDQGTLTVVEYTKTQKAEIYHGEVSNAYVSNLKSHYTEQGCKVTTHTEG